MQISLETLKQDLISSIDHQAKTLKDISLQIHANPELGFQEIQAADWLSEYLQANGFKIERPIADLKTAFKATYGTGKPVVAFIGEYDALPDVGHACGHNLIATASAGAAVAAKQLVDICGGQVQFIGTPAEELFGGKIIMAQQGVFKALDAALMVHPESGHNAATAQALACVTLYVEYFGKEAHAAAEPAEGVNALDAMVIAYSAVAALRQHMRPTARVHGIITNGGQAANVVPGHTAGSFLVRATDLEYLEILKDRVLDCFRSGAVATGAKLEHRWDPIAYAPLLNNKTLTGLFAANVKALGREIQLDNSNQAFGSTDMGNVSQVVPGLHGFISIAPAGVIGHTREFAQAAASSAGLDGMLDGAKALAMTAADLIFNSDTLDQVKEDFMSGLNP
ncbi:MAG: M20 family metallopeptidase [Dehalogenimonas sp.]